MLLFSAYAHMNVHAMLHLDMNAASFQTLRNGNATASLETTFFVTKPCCMVHVDIAAFHGCCQASLSCCPLHALPFHALPFMPCPSHCALHSPAA